MKFGNHLQKVNVTLKWILIFNIRKINYLCKS